MRAYPRLPVLRGFSRNVKQDSEANEVSGGESEANVAFLPRSSAADLSPAAKRPVEGPMRERPRFSGLAFTASAGKTDSEANAVSGGVSTANIVRKI
jgi:hypothetical protein